MVTFATGATAQNTRDADVSPIVRGTVSDPTGAVIAGANVIIRGIDGSLKAVTDSEGDYRVHLKPGVYEITTDIPAYHPVRRAQICVRSSEIVTINLAPTLRVLSTSLMVTRRGSQQRTVTAPPPKYDSFWGDHPTCGRVNLMVSFTKKRKSGRVIKYEQGVATYGRLTVFATAIRFDPRKLTLTATGKVVVEDGLERKIAQRATIDFSSGEPVVGFYSR